jgi:hypothetical protein
MTMRSAGMVAAKQRGSTLARDRTNSMNLSKRDLRDFRDLAYSNPDVEFLYLRENEFALFDPYIQLPKLKVLDLSINSLRGDLTSIAGCAPALRHLYLTGNQLTSLEGAMRLPNLETLCVSENLLESFEGLDSLPSLRVLSLNYNSIRSFRGFPYLPNLYALNLYGNPIADAAAYRPMAISVAPTIEMLDKIPASEDERAQAAYYLGKIAVCVTEGMVIAGDQPEEQAERFLLDTQREANKDRSLQVLTVSLHSAAAGVNQIVEGQPVVLSVCLQDARPKAIASTLTFQSDQLLPMRFCLLGDATEVLVVGTMNRWKDPIPMERSIVNGEVSFETTLYLPAGEYEYRYMVDGVERVLEENRVQSKFGQGPCNVCRVEDAASTPDDQHSDTILHVRWLRSNEANGFDIIEGENTLTYTPTSSDVGFCLRSEVLAYEAGQFSFLYFDVTTQVQPGPPRCSALALEGRAAEGEDLTAVIEYAGGVEGASIVQWFRVEPDGVETLVSVSGNVVEVYTCSLEDVGRRIKLEFTPVRADNEAGEKVSLLSPVVSSGVPTARSMEIRGAAVEGEQLTAVVVYAGGVEGPSTWQWYRLMPGGAGEEEFVPIAGQRTNTYAITAADVGRRLAVEYTPISIDGIRGETSRCTMEHPIVAGVPSVTNVAVTGALEEGHSVYVDFDYIGGRPGTHLIQWFSRDELPAHVAGGSLGGSTQRRHGDAQSMTMGRVPFGRVNCKSQALSIAEVGRYLEVELTPVREDGTRGDSVRARTMERVQPAAPALKSLKILVASGAGGPASANAGVPVGAVLEAVEEYAGGEQGASTVEWARGANESGPFTAVGRSVKYTVAGEDAGATLRLTYTPVRKDGVRGNPKVRLVAIAGPAPRAESAAPAGDAVPSPRVGEMLAAEPQPQVYQEQSQV